jgi:hypothetical protein
MKRILFPVLYALVVLLSDACSAPRPAATSQPSTPTIQVNGEENIRPDPIGTQIARGEPGIRTRLVASPALYNEQSSFSFGLVPTGDSFQALLEIENYTPIPIDIRFVSLLDYQQTPFLWEDTTEPVSTHDLHLEPDENTSITFTLPDLAQGFHDWILVGFYQPDDHQSSTEFRKASKSMILVQRSNLYVGDTSANTAPPTPAFRTIGFRENTNQIDGVLLNRSGQADPWRIWVQDEMEAGCPLNYYVNVSNSSAEPLRLAIMLFLDFEQIPVQENATTLFVELGPKQEDFISAELIVPNNAGPHELVALWVLEPYLPLQSESGAFAQIPLRSTQSTFRTLIVVDQE